MEVIRDIFVYNEDQPLLFTSLYFWIFFIIVFGIFSIIYKNTRIRNLYLLVISLFFYWKTGGWYFFLLIYSALLNYFIGSAMHKFKGKRTASFYLVLGLIGNLGVLFYYKYAYFFTDIINSIFHTNYEISDVFTDIFNTLTGSGLDASGIILPVGISFFTFQSISYIVDIYRKKIEPLGNFFDFAFYVSFFPQLVAGPIVRASEFIPQIKRKFILSRDEMGWALFLILNGLIKKMVISDYISINFVDRVFENPLAFSGFENLMAVYGYGIQIYCDFSGYTDIAIGVALLLGFRLPPNFKSPYKASSLTEFWHRWHISLSTWLRDYLYISMGGNRKGKFRMYLNVLITMLLGGLWHGASWQFVIWGAIHGMVLMLHKIYLAVMPDMRPNKIARFFGILITFNIVQFAWIFFRAGNMDVATDIIHQITNRFSWELIPQVIVSYQNIFGLMVFAYLVHWLPTGVKKWYVDFYRKRSWAIKILIALLILFVIYQVKSSDVQPFIYFQF
ncbi:MAG: MBOAT family protein [Bacteroidales bacterium]|nr:MBOAT family protein [Bacteroidales bacterium]MCF8352318.1 MBOAT family protein [Bacteroidales bacterium]MCF8401319.1 MBOAT family protein [Bacteroidales bacterium]